MSPVYPLVSLCRPRGPVNLGGGWPCKGPQVGTYVLGLCGRPARGPAAPNAIMRRIDKVQRRSYPICRPRLVAILSSRPPSPTIRPICIGLFFWGIHVIVPQLPAWRGAHRRAGTFGHADDGPRLYG